VCLLLSYLDVSSSFTRTNSSRLLFLFESVLALWLACSNTAARDFKLVLLQVLFSSSRLSTALSSLRLLFLRVRGAGGSGSGRSSLPLNSFNFDRRTSLSSLNDSDLNERLQPHRTLARPRTHLYLSWRYFLRSSLYFSIRSLFFASSSEVEFTFSVLWARWIEFSFPSSMGMTFGG
jgi:hypothetical protein